MAKAAYGKFLYALIEMQKAGAELLGRLSIDHIEGKSNNPNVAFANIILHQEENLKNLPSMAYPCNKTKLYDCTQNPPKLKNPIDLQLIDTTLQKDILFFLKGFPLSRPNKANRNDKVKCIGVCGSLCKKKDMCCDRCNQCKNCNRKLPPSDQCPVFQLNAAMRVDKKLRNLVSYMTLKTMQNFLDGQECLPDFPNVNTWQGLCQQFVTTMECICNFMMDKNNFQNNPNTALTQKGKIKKLDNLKAILKGNKNINCDITLLNNLKKLLIEEHQMYIDEIGNMFDDLKGKETKPKQQMDWWP